MSSPVDPWALLHIMEASESLNALDDEWGGEYLCPGCRTWQVGFMFTERDHANDIDGVLENYAAVLTAAAGHRAECPPFDMLAGLAGIPPT